MLLKGKSCGTWEYSGKKDCKAKRQGYSEDFQILHVFQMQVLGRKRYLIYIKYGSQHTFLPFTWLLESPLDCKETKPISPKGNHLWILEGLMLKLKLNTLATWCEELTHWKRPWCWERLKVGGEGMTEDEIVGWHHWLNGHEFVQTPGDSEGQGSLVCCSPWGPKESDMTERLNWTDCQVMFYLFVCVCVLVAQPCPISLWSHGL